MRIDLHAHSTASDGTDEPAVVMRRARDAGLDVVALTDHDTVAGHGAAATALPAGLTLVPGAELSCEWEGTSLHLLAYLFAPDHPELAGELDLLKDDRDRRAREMVVRLRSLGVDVAYDRVLALAAGGAVGRPHVARAMVEAGVVGSVAEAFTDEWIGSEGRAYVDKYALDPCRAVALVAAAGGVTVFAHPGAAKRGRVLPPEAVDALAAAGLTGIEVDHPDHDAATRVALRERAGSLGLLVTGSSDDHGSITGHRLGCETTDPEVFAALCERATGARPVTA
ncbi:MAG TPA: PHP domain-containing protein [Frankiaceae bacterium]|nr:PHP domain-containing protein [Frankiaceae bacterium]